MHIPFFRIFYSTTFTVLVLVLVVLLLVSPGDIIFQAYRNKQFINIFFIAGVYLLTLIISILIYGTRLFAIRSHLASIPKTWMPIEKSDVGKTVRRMIVDGLLRSALIAYETHPRDLRQDTPESESRKASSTTAKSLPSRSIEHIKIIHDVSKTPIWGNINHPGWSPPTSPDLPDLQYLPVILELPHLIEAKAVSLAPPDPLCQPEPDASSPVTIQAPLPDALAVEILQRPAMMGLRDYITHLTSIDMIQPPSLGADFLFLYEKARFSGHAVDEADFRKLMSIFAEILRGMKELDPAIVADLHAEDEDENDFSSDPAGEDDASLRSTETVEHTPFHTPMPYAGGFIRAEDEAKLKKSSTSRSDSESNSRSAPSRARTKSQATVSTSSTAASRRRQQRRQQQQANRIPSTNSLKRVRTDASSASSQRSGSSVIRLAEARAPLDLPYTIITTSSSTEEI
ncbi:hypothetical protein MMC24_003813 [Lignoscripta atroalba]|nr:hypothetical protein [Lignoscripta atroalba]